MKTGMKFIIPLLLVSLCLLSTTPANGQFQEPAKWIPNDANMIVLVRSKDVFESEIAKEQKWERERQRAFDAGAAKIPPSIDRFLISSQLDLQYMEPVWQVAVFESRRPVDLVNVSKKVGGNLDRIGGKQAISLPNDAYLVKVSENTVASMTPANRQMATRWVNRHENAQMRLSDYLSSAIKFADNKAHMIAAIDFEHSIRVEDIKEKLRESKAVSDSEVEEISQLLAGMKGVTLGITMDSAINGAIKVDFGAGSELLAAKGKDILFEALKNQGLFIDDLNSWEASVNGAQLILRGTFSATGLRQVGMLIEQPLYDEYGSEYGEDVNVKTKTVQYFKSIDALVSELRDKESTSLQSYARWFDRYARRIDDLSARNVDQKVVDYGQDIADGFRDISGVLLQGELSRFEARDDEFGYRNNYRGYRSRYYGRYERNYYRRQEGQAARQGGMNAQELMRNLDSRTAALRKVLEQEYDIDL